jgi:hypothetical protein
MQSLVNREGLPDSCKGGRLDQVVYRCGDCELDTANRIFRKAGAAYTLEPKVLQRHGDCQPRRFERQQFRCPIETIH